MKFKAGLLVGYNGEGYSGLQLNKDLNTIEKAIGECLSKVKAISESNSQDYSKIHICSSSRTDKGVHAVLNLIVCKIQKEINNELYKDLFIHLQEKGIHLYKIIRLTKGFVPSKQTAYRTYEYVIPTYFLQKGDITQEHSQNLIKYENTKEDTESDLTSCSSITKEKLRERQHSEKDIECIFGYRSKGEDVKVFNEIFLEFKGTRTYHNYTVVSNPKGKQRYIQDIKISEPFVVDDVEYVKITIEGQSFLLHQIRKMTYFALLLTRYKREDWKLIFAESFTGKLHIPKGPSQYLILDRPHFMEVKSKGKMVDNLEVDECERLKFKEKITKLIYRKENLYRFLACLDSTRWYKEEMPYLAGKSD